MSRKWNGNLLSNDYAGDSAATIVMDYVAIPCALVTTIGALWWVYTTGMAWPYYLLALIGGPVGGLFLASAVGVGAVALVVLLALVTLPFKAGYDRYTTNSDRREQ